MGVLAGNKATSASVNSLAGTSIIGGQIRVTNASPVGATETEWANTGSFTLDANSTFEVVLEAYWLCTVTGDDFIFQIRQTNVSGTVRGRLVSYGAASAPGGPYPVFCTYQFTTGGTATANQFSATVARGVGSGTAAVQAASKIYIRKLAAVTNLFSTV